jgi:hypothetical protein
VEDSVLAPIYKDYYGSQPKCEKKGTKQLLSRMLVVLQLLRKRNNLMGCVSDSMNDRIDDR